MKIDYNELSKEISYALRHAPHKYNLEIDECGWVLIEQLLHALQCDNKWRTLERIDIEQMVATSKKIRHKIQGEKIRARYGHSISNKILYEKCIPPDVLYHGTTHDALNSILIKGLLPQQRQYVHLSENIQMANKVGKRRDKHPVILIINSKQAMEDGIEFYFVQDKVWLANNIPPMYITIVQE